MRFVFISGMGGSPWGGSEELWSRSANELRKMGHAILCLTKYWDEDRKQISDLKAHGCRVIQYEGHSEGRLDSWKAFICNPLRPIHTRERAFSKILEFRPDLVCVSHGATLCGFDWMVRCKKNGVPFVSVAQANFEQWWPTDNRRDEVAEAYLSAKKAYFVSSANKNLFERQIAFKLKNGEVVWNPININHDVTVPWPNPMESGGLTFACVARLDPAAKGQDLIFEVLAQPKWRDRNIKVLLFGKGPFEKQLRSLAVFFGVSHLIEFRGHVSDVREIWRESHCLLLPSRFEGLPLCLVECLMAGRPAIVTDVAGNTEVLRDNVDGFVAEFPSVSSLDSAMERAWARRNEWQEMGKANAKRVREIVPTDPARSFALKLKSIARCNS